MKDIRKIVLSALRISVGTKSDASFFAAETEGVDLDFNTLEMDSLSRFEVMMHVEEALDIELHDDDISKFTTLNGLVAFLEAVMADET